MVRGLELFKKHFAKYDDKYVLIGGTACEVLMEEAGINFRATKDLDIVLQIEALDVKFVLAFWEFIKTGKYEHRQKSTDKEIFYRFSNPQNPRYPVIIELFSRMPNSINIDAKNHLTPIPTDEAVRSLSAILLNDDYYHFLQSGKRLIDGLPVVDASHLIPLKARAWLDLISRKEQGDRIDQKDIRKHRNDIFRLYQLLSINNKIPLSAEIKNDMQKFIRELNLYPAPDFRSLGLKNTEIGQVLSNLKHVYGIE